MGRQLSAFDQKLKASGSPSYSQDRLSGPKHQRTLWRSCVVTTPNSELTGSKAIVLLPMLSHFIWLIPYPIPFFSHDTLGALLNCLSVLL